MESRAKARWQAMSDYIKKQEAIDRLSEVLSSQEDFEIAKQVIIEAPTLDEKEIIRKYGEQIIKKLEFESEWSEPTFDEDGYCNDDSWEMVWLDKAIEIVKEECGISE